MTTAAARDRPRRRLEDQRSLCWRISREWTQKKKTQETRRFSFVSKVATQTHTTRPADPVSASGSRFTWTLASDWSMMTSSEPLPQPLISYQVETISVFDSKLQSDCCGHLFPVLSSCGHSLLIGHWWRHLTLCRALLLLLKSKRFHYRDFLPYSILNWFEIAIRLLWICFKFHLWKKTQEKGVRVDTPFWLAIDDVTSPFAHLLLLKWKIFDYGNFWFQFDSRSQSDCCRLAHFILKKSRENGAHVDTRFWLATDDVTSPFAAPTYCELITVRQWRRQCWLRLKSWPAKTNHFSIKKTKKSQRSPKMIIIFKKGNNLPPPPPKKRYSSLNDVIADQ